MPRTSARRLSSGSGRRGVRALNRISRRSLSHGFDRVDAFVAQIVMIRPRGRDWLAGVGFAAVNWIADVATLRHGLSRRGDFRRGSADDRDRVRCGRPWSAPLRLLPGGIGLVEGALVVASLVAAYRSPLPPPP